MITKKSPRCFQEAAMGLIQINPYACSLVAVDRRETLNGKTPNCMCPYITIERYYGKQLHYCVNSGILLYNWSPFGAVFDKFLSTGHVTQLELCASKLKE